VFDFLKHWVAREAQLQQQPGFLGLQVGTNCWLDALQWWCMQILAIWPHYLSAVHKPGYFKASLCFFAKRTIQQLAPTLPDAGYARA
jgi:hypothetical protein